MNMITVKINGMEYNLKGEENDEYLHKVAGYVDRKIRNITGSNSKLSTTAAAVLTAVNVVDDLFKCDNAYSELIKKVDELEHIEKSLLNKIEALNKKINDLEAENEDLKNKQVITGSEDLIISKDIEIERLSKENAALQENTKHQLNENLTLKANNKELKFQLQSAKYKIIGLEHKIIESHIDLAKAKQSIAPFINSEKK